jgi:glycosyltransferase involved in cell wall biosynthesis
MSGIDAVDEALPPLVSVVLLTYNRPELLREAIGGAIAQTYSHLEILICDNASDQPTTDVIRSFNDRRIQHIRRETNIGMTANAQQGFLAATGKYLTNLHDDDLWKPSYIEKVVHALESHPEAVLAFSDHSIIDPSGVVEDLTTNRVSALFGRSNIKPGLHQPFKKLALVDLAIPIAMATVFRKNAIDWNNFPDLTSVYDYWLAYLASKDGGACYYINEKLTYYRVHGNSESNNGRLRVNDGYIAIYKIILQDPRMDELRHFFIPRFADHYRDAAVSLLRSGNRRKAREYLCEGLKIHMTSKAALTYIATFFPSTFTKHLPKRLRFR